ncbi:DNA polymerase III subunit delta' [Gammaproteobacteria bacterium AH-315-M22]|nr:DNA polymerase III subunit delta' [Gammaproteobacteria bacterium AH-315-M22]
MTTQNMRLPWHETLWQQLEQSLQQQRLAHAYLIQGPAGVGKSHFAINLAKALLCEQDTVETQKTLKACGQCKSCHLFTVGSHPDYRLLASEEGKAIGVDVIRDTSAFFSLTRQYGRYQIAMISDAERMTIAAANALLKTLEEPPAGAILLLISEQASLLPATIRSRCQTLRFIVPAPDTALSWLIEEGIKSDQAQYILGLARGAPVYAKELANENNSNDDEKGRNIVVEGARDLYLGRINPVDLAESYLKLSAKHALYSLWQWKAEMVRNLVMHPYAFAGASFGGATNQNDADSTLAQMIGQRRLLIRISGLSTAIKRLDSQLNEQLILEDILISWI